MDIISAYREVGTYRGAAVVTGATHKTVKRVIARQEAGAGTPPRVPRGHNYDGVAGLVTGRAEKTLAMLAEGFEVLGGEREGPGRRFQMPTADIPSLTGHDPESAAEVDAGPRVGPRLSARPGRPGAAPRTPTISASTSRTRPSRRVARAACHC